MNKILSAHISVLGAMLIYGANYVIMKRVTPEHIAPLGLVVYRATGAMVLFWISGFFIREKLPPKDIILCAILAFFGVALNQMLFSTGLSITSPLNAAIMMLTSPLLVLVISVLLRRERASALKTVGVLVGCAGAFVVIMTGSQAVHQFKSSWQGDLLILANALSWGIFLIFSKPLMMKYHTVTVMKWVFLFGALYTFPFGFADAAAVDFTDFTGITWFNFLYVIVATTFIAYLLNTFSLKHLSSSVVSAYIYTQPFMAACFGLMFGMDQLNAWRVLGALIVFAGVYMVSYKPRV